MKGLPITIILAAFAAAPALAQGAIGTVESASRYSSPQGSGTYLRRGDTLQLTSGPRQGESYAVVGSGFLRRIEDGKPGRLRCVLTGRLW
jgi:hypothetical protein